MEKKIKFENIIGFINKAMEYNYEFDYRTYMITIYSSEEEYIDINYMEKDSKLYLYIGNPLIYNLKITDKRDICKWNLLLEDVKEYIAKSIENKFNNFFKGEPKKYKNIEDLDDKDN